jgi:dUTP pyrophosphatase
MPVYINNKEPPSAALNKIRSWEEMNNIKRIDTVKEPWQMRPQQSLPIMELLVIEPTEKDVVIPKYASEGDSGMDVYSRGLEAEWGIEENVILEPGCSALFKLGFKMQIPKHPWHDHGYRWEAQARPRSGVSMKTMLRVSNAPGTIDNFYVNEVGILLTNTDTPRMEIDLEFTGEDGFNVVENARLESATEPTIVGLDGKRVSSEELLALGMKDFDYERFPKGSILIRKNDRIAQLVFNEVIRPLEVVVGRIGTSEDRGGGFGHTGV